MIVVPVVGHASPVGIAATGFSYRVRKPLPWPSPAPYAELRDSREHTLKAIRGGCAWNTEVTCYCGQKIGLRSVQ